MIHREVRRSRTDEGDAGFTLIELIIAVAILGIICVSLTGVVIQYLKVTSSTQTRLNESTDIQLISTYWQHDVSSLGLRDFTPTDTVKPTPSQRSIWVGPTDTNGCTLSGATPIVSFSWNGYTIGASDATKAWDTPPSSQQKVAYVAVQSGSQYLVERVWCGTGTVPTLIVARNVTSWNVSCSSACDGTTLPATVRLNLHVQDKSDPTNTGASNTGTDVTLTGERRQS